MENKYLTPSIVFDFPGHFDFPSSQPTTHSTYAYMKKQMPQWSPAFQFCKAQGHEFSFELNSETMREYQHHVGFLSHVIMDYGRSDTWSSFTHGAFSNSECMNHRETC